MRASWESSRPTLSRSGSKVSSGRTAILGRSISAASGAKSARCSSPSTTWTEASTSSRVSSSSRRFSSLCRSADRDYPDHRLPVPVRFVLDDFANLRLPHIDDVLSVIRSREISCTVVCQTISQLEARYGEATANSIVGNCDSQLVLGFQDERTAAYFSCRANKTASTLLETPAGMWWVFLRGQRGAMDPARRLEDHPRYPEIIEAKRAKEARIELEEQRRREEEDRMLREIEEELNVSLEEPRWRISTSETSHRCKETPCSRGNSPGNRGRVSAWRKCRTGGKPIERELSPTYREGRIAKYGESASQNYSETRVACVFSQKDSSTPGALFRKARRPPDRLGLLLHSIRPAHGCRI